MFQRVLLVAPPSSSYLGGVRPPTGLGYVAQSLSDNHIAYAVADMRAQGRISDLWRTMQSFQPDLVGLSLVSFEYRRSYDLIHRIKATFPQAAIVVGGPHVSVLHRTVLDECSAIDFGILHEGEMPMAQLCRGELPHGEVPGLLYRQGGEVHAGPPPLPRQDLDAIAFPRFEHFPMQQYAGERLLVTSRGCPYRCIFCPNSLTAKEFRARSAANVVDEIEHWYARGIRQFSIDDDNFTLHKQRVHDICAEIERRELRGLFIRCANGIRADRVDRDLLAHMQQAGIREVAFGADGGNNRVLRDIVRKGETIDDIDNALQAACGLGLRVKLFIVVGHPGETPRDVEDSLALAQRYPIDWLHLNNPIPYPGTELYEWVRSHRAFIVPPEEYLNNVTEVDDTPVFETPELPRDVRKQILVRSRRIERDVKRHAVERMLHHVPLLAPAAGMLFASPFGQWLFFRNLWTRSLINRIWYRRVTDG